MDIGASPGPPLSVVEPARANGRIPNPATVCPSPHPAHQLAESGRALFTGPAPGGRNERRVGGGARSVRAALCSPGTLPAYPRLSRYSTMLYDALTVS